MKNAELTRQLQKLRSLMARACGSTTDPELQSHWARYFTVLSAGVIENSVSLLYGEYVTRVTHTPIANFAQAHLRRVSNPKSERLVRTAKQFNESWAAELESYLDDDGRKEAVDSIMNTRHQIAHGKNVGITIVRITDYLDKAEEVLEFIETQVRP